MSAEFTLQKYAGFFVEWCVVELRTGAEISPEALHSEDQREVMAWQMSKIEELEGYEQWHRDQAAANQ